MNPLELALSKLALTDAGDDHAGRENPRQRCAHPASLSATPKLTEGSERGNYRHRGTYAPTAGPAEPSVSFVEDALHAVVMEHRSQPPSMWRAFRALMDAEVDLEFLGLTDAATFARLARERLEESGLETA